MSNIRFEPAPGKLVIKRERPGANQHLTKAGLVIVTNPVDQQETGVVHAVYEPFLHPGEAEETKPFYEVGDIVLFGRHSGVKVELGREIYYVMMEREILSKLHIEEEEGLESVHDPVALPADYDAQTTQTQAIRRYEEQHG